MTDLAYRIKKLKELTQAKRAVEGHPEPTQGGLDSEPSSDMPEPEKNPLDTAPMPESLKGLTTLEIRLLFTDGQMTDDQEIWYQRKDIPDRFPHGPLEWMKR